MNEKEPIQFILTYFSKSKFKLYVTCYENETNASNNKKESLLSLSDSSEKKIIENNIKLINIDINNLSISEAKHKKEIISIDDNQPKIIIISNTLNSDDNNNNNIKKETNKFKKQKK